MMTGKKEFSYVVRDGRGKPIDVTGCTAHLQVFNNMQNARIVNDSYIITHEEGKYGLISFMPISTFLLIGAFSYNIYLISPLNGKQLVEKGKFYLDGR
jgi:hypothetical protein